MSAMEDQRPKIGPTDVAGILLLAGLIRGGKAAHLCLQFAGLLCGLAAVLALASGRTFLGLLLILPAWILWLLGYRLASAVAPKPLDLAARPGADTPGKKRPFA